MRDVRNLMKAVKEKWKARDFAGVIADSEAIIRLPDDNMGVWKARLRAAVALEDWKVAGESAQKLALAHPDLAFWCARKLVKAKEHKSAAAILDALRRSGHAKIVGFEKMATDLGLILLYAGTRAIQDGQSETAQECWLAGALAAPCNTVLQDKITGLLKNALNHARTQGLDQDPKVYMEAWSSVHELDPQNHTALIKLALGAEKQGNLGLSLEFWTRVLELDPAGNLARVKSARAGLLAGKELEVLSTLHRLGLADLDRADVKNLRTRVLRKCRAAHAADDLALAFDCISLLLKITPSEDGKLVGLRRAVLRKLHLKTRSAWKARDLDQGADFAKKTLELDKNNIFALYVLSRHAYQRREFQNAAVVARRILDADPNYYKARVILERTLEKSRPVPTLSLAAA